ncbi:MTH1187 family thiamine-binding protein [Paenibacillus sp. YYML68]|uniref:MTH1187 family thiamine-binding protein n=1 Tax=Paenibacillus sp. YYML68 TaxID=2909250 RepID=UPI002491B08F|nr:MTH1187 family thiamine-binding protein [Paenibacillus sp. YYML68]
MAIAEITVIPVGTESTSLSAYVAGIHRYLEQESAGGRISFEMTAMSTIVEGELTDLLRVVQGMHEQPFTEGAHRVCTSIKLDDRRDKQGSIAQKLHSIAERLNR